MAVHEQARGLDRLAEAIRRGGIKTIKMGGPDLEGVFRGKRFPVEQFLVHLEQGFAQCDCLFGWDINEDLIDGLRFTGWQTGFPDMEMLPDPDTFRVVPWEAATASVIADFARPDGQPVEVSPRHVLKRVIARARAMGFEPYTASELEFRLYRETAQSVRAKDWKGLEPISPSLSCYAIWRASGDEFIVGRICELMNAYDVSIEGYNREHGPGMYEINIRYADALRSADNTMLYKTGVKEICAQQGLLASFMAKPFDHEDGLSCHTHLSLWDAESKANLFAADGGGMSDLLRHFLAGVAATARELLALYAPSVNSYKRYVPGTWAPTSVTWGYDNRTAALRVIAPHHPREATRLEVRLPGADCNPYLAMAAALAGGLSGIASELEPPPPISGNAYDVVVDPARRLPRTLSEAADALEASELAVEFFGEPFVHDYLVSRRWEAERYNRVVGEWERARYLEMI
jgi:glutamine synthetase